MLQKPGHFFLKQVVWSLQLTYYYTRITHKYYHLFPIKRAQTSIKRVNIFRKHSGRVHCPKKHTNESWQFYHTVALSSDIYTLI